MRLLLENGAEVDSPAGGAIGTGTALQNAALWGNESLVRLLLERGANVNAQPGSYGTALHNAVISGNEALVRLLVGRGADVNAPEGEYGTVLETAAAMGDKAVMRLLLDSLSGLVSGRSFDDIAAPARVFLSAVQELVKSGTASVEEMFFMRCMCKDIFSWLTGTLGDKVTANTVKTKNEGTELFWLVELVLPLFQADLAPSAPGWMRASYRYLRIQMLMCRLQIYLNYYLTYRAEQHDWEPLVPAIQSALIELETINGSTQHPIRWLEEDIDVSRRLLLNSVTSHERARFRQEEYADRLLWQPSLLAHYAAQFSSFLPAGPAQSSSIDRVEIGFSVSRLINWCPGLFKMSSLTAMQGLLVLTRHLLGELKVTEGPVPPSYANQSSQLRARRNFRSPTFGSRDRWVCRLRASLAGKWLSLVPLLRRNHV